YGAFAVKADVAGNAYLAGPTSASNFPTTAGAAQPSIGGGLDVFVTKLDTTASGNASLVYSTFLGRGAEGVAYGLAMDASANVYVSGYTRSANFPVTPGVVQPAYGGGASDAFVAKLDTTASGAASLVYSTYLGGSGDDSTIFGIAVDPARNVFIAG